MSAMLKSKDQYLFWDSSNHLIVVPCEIKKKKYMYLQHHRIYITFQNVTVRKYWTKHDRTPAGKLQAKHYISVSDVKALFRSPNLFCFVDCSIILFLCMLPIPVISFPRQVSHGSGIFIILGLPGDFKIEWASTKTYSHSGILPLTRSKLLQQGHTF